MFGSSLNGSDDQLFITTALTLPGRKNCVRISGVLVNGAPRRNDLPATPRAGTSAGRAPLNIYQSEEVILGLVIVGVSISPICDDEKPE